MLASRVVLRLERPGVSWRFRVGSLVVLLAAVAAVLALISLGVGTGDAQLTIPQVWDALLGGGEERARFVVWELRLPRLLTAVLVGVALALSGSIFQALARDPLVAPDIIGINGGAALAVVAVIVWRLPDAMLTPASFAGGLAVAVALYALAWRRGISGRRLVLIGIGIGAATEAAIAYLLTRGQVLEIQEATIWLVGSLYAASWGDAAMLAGSFAVLLPLTFAMARPMTGLQLGDDLATSLGVPTERSRLALIAIAVALCAVSVTAVGRVAFVAFIAPHVARRLARTTGTGELAASAAIGALLVLGSDIVARRLFDPAELPVGIITVLLGGPFFLALLLRSDRIGSGV